jgi:hypothetical protein
MTYKQKAIRQAEARKADAQIQILLNMFGNFLLEKRGVTEKVTNEEMKDFVSLLENKKLGN